MDYKTMEILIMEKTNLYFGVILGVRIATFAWLRSTSEVLDTGRSLGSLHTNIHSLTQDTLAVHWKTSKNGLQKIQKIQRFLWSSGTCKPLSGFTKQSVLHTFFFFVWHSLLGPGRWSQENHLCSNKGALSLRAQAGSESGNRWFTTFLWSKQGQARPSGSASVVTLDTHPCITPL